MMGDMKLPTLLALGFDAAILRATEIPCTVTCGWCDRLVPDDSEAPEGFCSDNCYETNRAEDDNFGRDYDAGPNTSDRGILRDEFHV